MNLIEYMVQVVRDSTIDEHFRSKIYLYLLFEKKILYSNLNSVSFFFVDFYLH